MTEALGYIVNSAAWSAGGFAVGWFVASTRRDMRAIKKAVERRDPDEPDAS